MVARAAARKPQQKPETALSKAIPETLRWRFGDCLLIERINAGVVMVGTGKARRPFRAAPAGWADLIGVLFVALEPPEYYRTGRFVALEVKVGKAKPSDKQRAFLESVRAKGGFAAVVNSVEAAVAAIERAKEGARSE